MTDTIRDQSFMYRGERREGKQMGTGRKWVKAVLDWLEGGR